MKYTLVHTMIATFESNQNRKIKFACGEQFEENKLKENSSPPPKKKPTAGNLENQSKCRLRRAI